MISVIIPIHNALRWVLLTLEALKRHATTEIQIVPVCDRCEEIVPYTLAKLGYDPVITNFGEYHQAASKGVDYCNGKYIMICNSDMVFSPDWDCPLLRELESGEKIVVSSLHIQRFDGIPHDTSEYLEPKAGIWTGPGLPKYPEDLDWDWFLKVCAKLKKEYKGHWVENWHFAHQAMSKENFESIGRFRNMISDSSGKNSMAKKLIRLGFSNRVVFDSQVLHFVGASGRRSEGNDISTLKEWWPWDNADHITACAEA